MTDPQSSAPQPIFRDTHSAPFIYFDLAPSFGVMAGAIEIELVARILVPSLEPAPKSELITTARLRCSPTAAASLRDAIDKALQMDQRLREQASALAASIGTGTAH